MTTADTERVAVTPVELLQGPDAFQRWLAGQPELSMVGFSESLFACPIATYLKFSGVNHPVVGPMYVRWDWVDRLDPREAPGYILPDWCSDFVRKVDRDWRGAGAVTAGRALAILREVAHATHSANGVTRG